MRSMLKLTVIAASILFVGVPVPVDAQDYTSKDRPAVLLIQQRCVKCHNDRVAKGGIDFSHLQGALEVWKERQIFTKALDMLRRGVMPPDDQPALPDGDRTLITDWLAHTLAHVDIDRIPHDPGFVPPRRLTRREYAYTVQDLFGIDFDPSHVFPEDQTIGDGFDNAADTLTVEPLWFEKALEAADETVHAVWADSEALDRLTTKRPSAPLAKDSAVYVAVAQTSRRCDMGDGGFSVLARVDGESGHIFLRAPRGEGFVRGSMEFFFEEDALVYRLQEGRALRAEGVDVGDGEPHWVGLTVRDGRTSLYLDGRLLVRRADFRRTRYQNHPLKIGRRKRRSKPALAEFRFYGDGLSDEMMSAVTEDGMENSLSDPLFHWVRGMESPTPEGFVTVQEAGAQVLTEFLRRAFRRALTEDEVSRYFGLFQGGIDSGLPFDVALQEPVAVALTSPSFLFRAEKHMDGEGPIEVSGTDMASRLSYFLWSSMPDTELRVAAESGKLQDPEELIRQANRMLADDKAERFFERFVLQWLRTEGLGDTVKPDAERFPEVSDSLLASMRKESVMLFGNTVRENRSLLKLLDDDSTFMNGELAAHYGYAKITGPQWREVRLNDSARGGLLTQAAVLTVSSSPRRTSPVFRGKWVLEVLLGEPPPPPPPNVPELSVEAESGGASLRELLEAHRSREVCAGCHRRIDPYGLTLEQYDAVGRLRTDERDTSATLFNGQHLRGVEDLKRYLVDQKGSVFLRHLTRRLLVYALGRELTFPDERPVQLILERLQRDGHAGAKALIHGIVLSEPFRYRMEPR